jgi:uncharacterized membrane protein
MFVILLIAWVVKISTPSLQTDEAPSGLVHTAADAIDHATLGPIPGWLVVAGVVAFYIALFAMAFTLGKAESDVSEGDVHV